MLHERGAEWLAAVPLPPGVKNLRVVACEIDDRKRVRVRSDAALADVHEATGRARGYARLVTIRFDVTDHPEPVDVTIELPVEGDPLRRALRGGGAPRDGRAGDARARPDPGRRAVARARAARVALVRSRHARSVRADGGARHARARSRQAPERARAPALGSLLRAFDVPGEDAAYVVGENVAIRAFDAKPEALVWYAIDWSRVAEALREQMGFAPARVTGAPEGFVPIGLIGPAGKSVIALLVTRAVAAWEVSGFSGSCATRAVARRRRSSSRAGDRSAARWPRSRWTRRSSWAWATPRGSERSSPSSMTSTTRSSPVGMRPRRRRSSCR
jgi:hypothetical protein